MDFTRTFTCLIQINWQVRQLGSSTCSTTSVYLTVKGYVESWLEIQMSLIPSYVIAWFDGPTLPPAWSLSLSLARWRVGLKKGSHQIISPLLDLELVAGGDFSSLLSCTVHVSFSSAQASQQLQLIAVFQPSPRAQQLAMGSVLLGLLCVIRLGILVMLHRMWITKDLICLFTFLLRVNLIIGWLCVTPLHILPIILFIISQFLEEHLLPWHWLFILATNKEEGFDKIHLLTTLSLAIIHLGVTEEVIEGREDRQHVATSSLTLWQSCYCN